MRCALLCGILLMSCSPTPTIVIDTVVTLDSGPIPDAPASETNVTDQAMPDLVADVVAVDAPAADIVAADAGNPFPGGPTGCMGSQGTLPRLGSRGNISVFSGCTNAGGASRYLLVWGGKVGSLGQAQLSALKAKHSTALLAIKGILGHGISACCVKSKNAACLSIYISANTSSVWELARALDTIFANEPDCFGIVADVPGKLGPRCNKGDPRCEPIPICDSVNNFDPTCCTVPKYNPSVGRVPTLPAHSSLELPQTPGECSHDGECMLNGCGNHCVAYTAPTKLAFCPCYPALKESFCGCVGGQCVWYEQK